MMAQSWRILFHHNLKRCLSTTTINSAQNGFKQAKVMNKLMKRDTTKRKWHMNKVHSNPSPLTTEKLISSHVTRRMTVLNKLFMKHITDLMATGEASTELLGRSIEVSRVQLTPDFTTVLVYWSSINDDAQFQTEKILNDCAFSLRHELTQLRVIGKVPMIKFVKDKQLEALGELERRLKNADYGDDHEPVASIVAPKQELTLNIKLPLDVREKILQLEDEEAEKDEAMEKDEEVELEEDYDESEFHVDLPQMRHDVLGLDHYAIMKRVKQSLKKSHDASVNRLSNVITFLPNESNIPIDLSTFDAAKSESKAFASFLIHRQTEERRKLRREKRDSVLAYNLDLENDESNDGDVEELQNDGDDIDILEDISLESIK